MGPLSLAHNERARAPGHLPIGRRPARDRFRARRPFGSRWEIIHQASSNRGARLRSLARSLSFAPFEAPAFLSLHPLARERERVAKEKGPKLTGSSPPPLFRLSLQLNGVENAPNPTFAPQPSKDERTGEQVRPTPRLQPLAQTLVGPTLGQLGHRKRPAAGAPNAQGSHTQIETNFGHRNRGRLQCERPAPAANRLHSRKWRPLAIVSGGGGGGGARARAAKRQGFMSLSSARFCSPPVRLSVFQAAATTTQSIEWAGRASG